MDLTTLKLSVTNQDQRNKARALAPFAGPQSSIVDDKLQTERPTLVAIATSACESVPPTDPVLGDPPVNPGAAAGSSMAERRRSQATSTIGYWPDNAPSALATAERGRHSPSSSFNANQSVREGAKQRL